MNLYEINMTTSESRRPPIISHNFDEKFVWGACQATNQRPGVTPRPYGAVTAITGIS